MAPWVTWPGLGKWPEAKCNKAGIAPEWKGGLVLGSYLVRCEEPVGELLTANRGGE